MPIAPDCEEIAKRPAGTGAPAKVPRSLTDESLFSTPSVLGPTMRKPADRTISSSCRCRPVSSPAPSANLETTSSALAPMRAASAATSRTLASGTAITTSSGRFLGDRRGYAPPAPNAPHPRSGSPGPPPPEAAGDQVREQVTTPAARLVRGPDNGNRGRREDRAERRNPPNVVSLLDSLLHGLRRLDVKETNSSSKSNLLRRDPARPKTASIASLLSMTSASKRANLAPHRSPPAAPGSAWRRRGPGSPPRP